MLAVFGAAITAASWVGGDHWLAVGLGIFYVVGSVAFYLWSCGHGDVAAILRLSGDERQRLIDTRASAVAGLVTALRTTTTDLALAAVTGIVKLAV